MFLFWAHAHTAKVAPKAEAVSGARDSDGKTISLASSCVAL